MPATACSIALISDKTKAASAYYSQRIFPRVADFAQATQHEQFRCDCVVLDIREHQQDNLQALAQLTLDTPVIALLDNSTQFAPGYPFGCQVTDVASLEELPSPLFDHRLERAINQFRSPLELSVLDHPMIEVFQEIANHTSDWILVKDLEHRFVFVTDKFVKASGLEASNIIGKNDLEIGHTREQVFGDPQIDWRGFWAQDDEVTQSGIASIESNPTWRAFSQAPRHKLTLRIPLKNKRGEVFALLVCTHDVTEQKQNERMLRDRTEMLARVTREKQNAESHRQIAEQAVSSKNKFLAAASHDLRQPLHAMGLFLDVLESRMTSKEDLGLMQKLKQSTSSLNNLFNSLLDISRLDAGVVEPSKTHISADRLFDGLCEEFRHQAAAKNLEFVGHCDKSVMYSDFVLLSRIVRNLVVNAIDNTESGRVSLTCQCCDEAATGTGQSGGQVLLLVTDTGPGIPEKEHQQIFEEFHQVTGNEGVRGKGIGLGLAIVKRLCELLSIEIAIESTLGKGTCFVMRVPAGDATAVEAENNRVAELSLHGITLLILDDDIDIREGMEALLQVYGCHTLSAGTLDEVFSQLTVTDSFPDLIIADYDLGQELTGEKMIDTLRQELGEQVPAILVTGDTSSVPESKAAQLGLPVLHKPIKPHEMIAVIANQLSLPSQE